MPLKKTVGAERRMDLASFFCMIGRHGPAVALAVVAVVTVLAGFYIYRTVKGRRRKAACDDGAVSPGEEDRDTSVTQQSPHRSEESTDVNNVMEDVGNLRRRPAAATEEKRPTSPPQIQTSENKPAAVFRAAQAQPEEAHRRPEVRNEESCVGNQEEHEEVLEGQRPDDGDVSRNTGREEKRRCSTNTSQICGKTDGDCQRALERTSNGTKDGPSRDQPAEAVELSESQPEEEKHGNHPDCDEEDEEEALSCDCTVSSHEERKRSNMSVPAAEASDAGSSPPCQRQEADEISQRVDETSESLIHGPAEEPSHLRSAPDGAPPPVCDLRLLSEQLEKKKDDEDAASSAGAESGISSLAVSPDMEADGNIFPMNGGDPPPEAVNSLSGSSVVTDQLTELTSFQSCTQMFHSKSVRWTHQQSSTVNEDMFGHELEDRYHSYYDQFAAQIAVSEQLAAGADIRTSLTSVQVVETTEKTSISVKKKEDLETEADQERTEISIMEATMDTNEWITDGNAPLLPWMAPNPPDQPQLNQLPSDESPASEVPLDVPPSTEAPQTGTLFADESMEPYKKVVAVPPMPQNVNVTFRVHYHTQSPYQTLAVTGDHPELGNWKEFIPLEKVKEGHWSTVVSLPTESHVEWKFVLLDKGEVCRWEECRNRLLDTGLGDDVVVHKLWGLA